MWGYTCAGGLKRTYSAAVRSPHHVVVLELQVLVEDVRVQLHLAVELIAHLLPVGCGLGHGDGDSSAGHGAA